MSSLIRFRARKEDDTVEVTIGLSKGLLIGCMAVLVTALSFGYVVMPAQSQYDSRSRKAIEPKQNYSTAIEAGDFVFLSGKIASRNGKVLPGGIKPETKKVMNDLKKALAKSGLTMDDVVKSTVYLGSLDDYAGMNEVYGTFFTGDKPARSTVQSGVVLNAGVEIDLIAYRGGK